MNPFKYKETTLSSGFYFDSKKKVIVYLDIDVEDVDFGSKTIYSRLSENSNSSSSSLEMLMSMRNMSNINNLCDLSILEEEKELNSKLKEDFKWICKDPTVKEYFTDFLEKNELYNLLYLFNQFLNPVKGTEESKGFTEGEKRFIANFFDQLKK